MTYSGSFSKWIETFTKYTLTFLKYAETYPNIQPKYAETLLNIWPKYAKALRISDQTIHRKKWGPKKGILPNSGIFLRVLGLTFFYVRKHNRYVGPHCRPTVEVTFPNFFFFPPYSVGLTCEFSLNHTLQKSLQNIMRKF